MQEPARSSHTRGWKGTGTSGHNMTSKSSSRASSIKPSNFTSYCYLPRLKYSSYIFIYILHIWALVTSSAQDTLKPLEEQSHRAGLLVQFIFAHTIIRPIFIYITTFTLLKKNTFCNFLIVYRLCRSTDGLIFPLSMKVFNIKYKETKRCT